MARRFDIRALAKRINERRKEYALRHPERNAPMNHTISRILEHDEDYVPMPSRRGNRKRPPLLGLRAVTVHLPEYLVRADRAFRGK